MMIVHIVWYEICLRVQLQDDALICLILETQIHLISIWALLCFDSHALNLSIAPFDCTLRAF